MFALVQLFIGLTCAASIEAPPSWNYDKGGADWNFTACNNTQWVQAPINTANMSQNVDWKNSSFSFLPDYFSGKSLSYGIKNYVYQLAANKNDGQTPWGVLYAAAPVANFPANNQLYLVPFEVRYHYPSEHYINGTRFDLEMQVVHADVEDRGVLCNGTAIISIFFNINDTAKDTGFFDW